MNQYKTIFNDLISNPNSELAKRLSASGPLTSDEMQDLEKFIGLGVDKLNTSDATTAAYLMYRRRASAKSDSNLNNDIVDFAKGHPWSTLPTPQTVRPTGRYQQRFGNYEPESTNPVLISPSGAPFGSNSPSQWLGAASPFPKTNGGIGGDDRSAGQGNSWDFRVFVVNWPKEFGGTGVGGSGAPTIDKEKSKESDREDDNKWSWSKTALSLLGVDPFTLSIIGTKSLSSRVSVGAQAIGSQLGRVIGNDNPIEAVGGALGAVGATGLMLGGPIGGTIATVALLGSAAAKAASGLMNFGGNLLKANFQFAEFSGAMTNVQVLQEIRDIYHGMRTGNARAASAEYLAQANENLRHFLEPSRNALANTWNFVTGMAINNLVGMGMAANESLSPQTRRGLSNFGAFLAMSFPLLFPFAARAEAAARNRPIHEGDAGGLMPWVLNPAERGVGIGGWPEPDPRAWEERWHRPERFNQRGPGVG